MQNRHFDRLLNPDRRQALVVGTQGVMALGLSQLLGVQAAAPPAKPIPPAPRTPGGTARSVILVWLSGGPSHMDTFDPKPGTGAAYAGKFDRDIATNVSGIRLAQTLPLLAKHADKYALIRGMTHDDFGHETASYKNLTGTTGISNLSYPLVGAIIAQKRYEAGYKGALPPFVVLGDPFTRIGGAGFLGRRCEAFVSSSVSTPPAGALAQAQGRRTLLQTLDKLGEPKAADAAYRDITTSRDTAYGLILGDERKVFDRSDEPKSVLEKYGTGSLGPNCLLARRLVERGVPFVAINHGGWDTHARNCEQFEKYLGPALDQGLSALLSDLHERGLLKTTVVVCVGEFGRTPEIHNDPPWFGGRHHHGHAFSALVAGGGFQGGQVVGATDRIANKVVKRPVYPWDLWGSIYYLLGIDPNGMLPHPEGRMVRVSPSAAGMPAGGLLTEIM
ncbi:MAG: DUF1501 domain-containing protein [Gemmataceae bacterium]